MTDWRISPNRPCPCGSGKPSRWLKDARGIAVARVCEDCEAGKKQGYRPDIFTDPSYWADETIEDD